MEILQSNENENGKFYIEIEGEVVAEMTYTWRGADRIIINHTSVDERLKGKGAGKQMVVAAVEFARAKRISIIAQCQFAKSVFDKVGDLRDVL